MFYFVLLAWLVSCVLKLISSSVCSIVAAEAPVPSKKLESSNLALQPSNCLLWCHWLVWNVSRVLVVFRPKTSNRRGSCRVYVPTWRLQLSVKFPGNVPWRGLLLITKASKTPVVRRVFVATHHFYSCPLRIRVQALRWYKWKAIDYVPWFIMHALRCRSILTGLHSADKRP